MGFIKEPEGVDFIIQSPPLTDEEKKAISEFIRKNKAKKSLAYTKKRIRNLKSQKELAQKHKNTNCQHAI